MSELRKNPLTNEWVIISEERSSRPHGPIQPKARADLPPYDETCPFCPGNDAMTPPTSLRIPDGSTGSWQVRGFDNLYRILSPEPPPLGPDRGPLFEVSPGTGAHEVLVESPLHNSVPADRSDRELAVLLHGCQERYVALMGSHGIQYVLVFKNHGLDAGASKDHPHSQIVASSVVPGTVLKGTEIADEHYRSTGRCLMCQVADGEARAETRIVYRGADLVVFHPFAASYPAETWIVPLIHRASFGQATGDELRAVAAALGRTLRQLRAGFGDPDFNYMIHSAPRGQEESPSQHWYVQIVPRMSRAAGWELGTAMSLNPMAPETAARIMREAPSS